MITHRIKYPGLKVGASYLEGHNIRAWFLLEMLQLGGESMILRFKDACSNKCLVEFMNFI